MVALVSLACLVLAQISLRSEVEKEEDLSVLSNSIQTHFASLDRLGVIHQDLGVRFA